MRIETMGHFFSHFHHDLEDPFGAEKGNNFDLSYKILSLSIISFSLIMVLLFSHYLFNTCVHNQRQSRRRREAIRRLNLTLEQLHHTELGIAGLDPALIATLPIFVVESKPQEEQCCAVCLGGLEENEMAKLLPNCNHYFHVDCIDAWLGLHSNCPLCRATVQTRLEPQNREGPVALDGAPPFVVLRVLENSEGTSEGCVGEEPKIDGFVSRV